MHMTNLFPNVTFKCLQIRCLRSYFELQSITHALQTSFRPYVKCAVSNWCIYIQMTNLFPNVTFKCLQIRCLRSYFELQSITHVLQTSFRPYVKGAVSNWCIYIHLRQRHIYISKTFISKCISNTGWSHSTYGDIFYIFIKHISKNSKG